MPDFLKKVKFSTNFFIWVRSSFSSARINPAASNSLPLREETIDQSAAAILFVRTAYSTMHAMTLMIGVLRTNDANGHIPNADTQEQDETAFLRPIFFAQKTKNEEKRRTKIILFCILNVWRWICCSGFLNRLSEPGIATTRREQCIIRQKTK